jgi:uncharacterized membrane protein YebE (DUF533 family)
MDEAKLLEGVLRGVLGGRRKRGRRTSRYLTGPSLGLPGLSLPGLALPGLGRIGGSLLSNPTVLLTAAGVAWGLIETMSGQGNQAGTPPAGGGTPSTAMPPLPVMGGAPALHIQNDAHRMVLLAISAAQADGAMGDKESAEVQRVAIEQGMAAEVAAGLTRPTPLASIVAGVTDPGQRATLYGLAFSVARADEQVSGAERIYLAQLANLLGLDPAAVAKLEATAAAKIDEAPEEDSVRSS